MTNPPSGAAWSWSVRGRECVNQLTSFAEESRRIAAISRPETDYLKQVRCNDDRALQVGARSACSGVQRAAQIIGGQQLLDHSSCSVPIEGAEAVARGDEPCAG